MVNETSPQPGVGHDAQRELERKALRNVRGLVDRIEADEHARRRSQKWVIGGIVVAVAVLAVLLAVGLARKPQGQEIVVTPPAAKAPAR